MSSNPYIKIPFPDFKKPSELSKSKAENEIRALSEALNILLLRMP